MRSVVRLAGVFCLVFLTAAPVAADKSAKDGASAEVRKSKDRVECRRVRVTGSHFRQRVCQTASAWAELRKESQDAMRGLTDGRHSSGTSQ